MPDQEATDWMVEAREATYEGDAKWKTSRGNVHGFRPYHSSGEKTFSHRGKGRRRRYMGLFDTVAADESMGAVLEVDFSHRKGQTR